jgi:hypothetical protein
VNDQNQFVLLSFTEAVYLLKQAFREQVARMIARKDNYTSMMTSALNYNCVPYIDMLLSEIFNQGHDPDLSSVAPSTIQLIKDGMEQQYAQIVATEIYRSIVEVLAGNIPNMTFGNLQDWTCQMCGEYDAMLLPAIKERIREYAF